MDKEQTMNPKCEKCGQAECLCEALKKGWAIILIGPTPKPLPGMKEIKNG